MIPMFKKIIITLLVLLQMIAPWVHAHPPDAPLATGFLHLPGLERYDIGSNSQEIQTLTPFGPSAYLIIGINTGICANTGHLTPRTLSEALFLFRRYRFPELSGTQAYLPKLSPERGLLPSSVHAPTVFSPRAPPFIA